MQGLRWIRRRRRRIVHLDVVRCDVDGALGIAGWPVGVVDNLVAAGSFGARRHDRGFDPEHENLTRLRVVVLVWTRTTVPGFRWAGTPGEARHADLAEEAAAVRGGGGGGVWRGCSGMKHEAGAAVLTRR